MNTLIMVGILALFALLVVVFVALFIAVLAKGPRRRGSDDGSSGMWPWLFGDAGGTDLPQQQPPPEGASPHHIHHDAGSSHHGGFDGGGHHSGGFDGGGGGGHH